MPLFLLALAAAAAMPAPPPPPAPAAPVTAAAAAAATDLYVALVVNGVEDPTLVSMRETGAHLWVETAGLRRAGLQVGGGDTIDVTSIPGVEANYDREGQRLLLDVPLTLLPTRRLNGDTTDWMAPTIDSGALLNYNLYLQRSGGETIGSLWSEQRLFGRWGTLANTGVARAGGGLPTGYIRYDTTFEHIDEEHALTTTAGDLVTGALAWTTAVRAGGVRIARSFRTRPDLVTVPLPQFAGQAALPSGVDLFINGFRQQHNDVTPGRFVLDDVPVVTGAGEARLVTTDATGRQIATVIPFYVAPELLRPGLTDFSFDVGALRRGYGLDSFSYGRGIVSGSLRYGATNRITMEAHGEGARGLALAGMGIAWSPGKIGALYASAAVSHRDGQGGGRYTIGYNYVGRGFGFGGERIVRTRAFADLGSFDLKAWAGRTESFRASASARIASVGSVGLGFIDARSRDGSRARLGSASFSLPLGPSASMFAAADYDFARRDVTAQVRLVLPLGRNVVTSTGLARQPDGRLRFQADAARSVPTTGGLGWSAGGAYDDRSGFVGQGTATYRADIFEIDAGTARGPGSSSVWGGISGALTVLDGKPYLANQLPDAFAVVSTGMPGVAVYYENQHIGKTAADGKLFVPRAVAYHPGDFSIDISHMPATVTARTTSTRVALREGTGAIVRLKVETVRSATVRLRDANGQLLPAGTPVTLSDGVDTVAGWDGVVLIERVDGPVALTAVLPDGTQCHATVTVPAGAEPVANLGSVICR